MFYNISTDPHVCLTVLWNFRIHSHRESFTDKVVCFLMRLLMLDTVMLIYDLTLSASFSNWLDPRNPFLCLCIFIYWISLVFGLLLKQNKTVGFLWNSMDWIIIQDNKHINQQFNTNCCHSASSNHKTESTFQTYGIYQWYSAWKCCKKEAAVWDLGQWSNPKMPHCVNTVKMKKFLQEERLKTDSTASVREMFWQMWWERMRWLWRAPQREGMKNVMDNFHLLQRQSLCVCVCVGWGDEEERRGCAGSQRRGESPVPCVDSHRDVI